MDNKSKNNPEEQILDTINVPELHKCFNDSQGIIDDLKLPKVNSNLIPNPILPLSDNYMKSVGKIINSYKNVIELPTYNFSEMITVIKPMTVNFNENFKEAIINISSISESVSEILQSVNSFMKKIDFTGLIDSLNDSKKKRIAYCLVYDIYPPLTHIDFISAVAVPFENQQDADIFLIELLKYFEEEHNKTTYDFIPLSLRTYHEINKLQELEKLGFYKLMVIFCIERIEYILTEMQLAEEGSTLAKVKTNQPAFREFIDLTNIKNQYLIDLIKQITYIKEFHEKNYLEVSLFKRFSDIEELYNNGVLPLNRNLYMHGRVNDNQVDYLTVQKSLLAFSFFEQLFVLKKQDIKKSVLRKNRHYGLSKITKNKSSLFLLYKNRVNNHRKSRNPKN